MKRLSIGDKINKKRYALINQFHGCNKKQYDNPSFEKDSLPAIIERKYIPNRKKNIDTKRMRHSLALGEYQTNQKS